MKVVTFIGLHDGHVERVKPFLANTEQEEVQAQDSAVQEFKRFTGVLYLEHLQRCENGESSGNILGEFAGSCITSSEVEQG